MKELIYPFDVEYLIKNRKKIKKQLMLKEDLISKNIAILGGSTTSEVKNMLEIFLLNYGIKPTFYESEYNKYYEDALFGNSSLDNFEPDIIYIHTTNRNIIKYPTILDDEKTIDLLLKEETNKMINIWEALYKKFKAVIIQNNFEYPCYRLLGNKDAVSRHGRINFINKLNNNIYEYANNHSYFYVNDINYLASCYGLDKWANEFYWYMYKYALEVPAIPYLAFNLANIIKSIYGKNKKALVVDLDNTLWGGVVGDDGVNGLAIGKEVPTGQVYYEFQEYLKSLKDLGIILNIASKNDEENALAGLNHPEGLLKPDDFVVIKANWNPKNESINEIASLLNLGADSFVFVDDNPAERHLVLESIPNIAVPDLKEPENFRKIIDHNGYFEMTNFTEEDKNKNNLYKDLIKSKEMINSFANYDDYLKSLHMKAEIASFKPIYLERIAELTNKSNQFNLTTKRYSGKDIEKIALAKDYLTLYGKLKDIFGDNGVISVVIGLIKKQELHIDLWLMSCRVLKRGMEEAMMDKLVSEAKKLNITTIYGYYYKTAKNKMVEDFYDSFGFQLIEKDDNHKKYKLNIKEYQNKNKIIEVE